MSADSDGECRPGRSARPDRSGVAGVCAEETAEGLHGRKPSAVTFQPWRQTIRQYPRNHKGTATMALPALANWDSTRVGLHHAAQVVGAIRKVDAAPLPNYLHYALE